jgi:hypothetical protein
MVYKILQIILLGFSKGLYQTCTFGNFDMAFRRLRTAFCFVGAMVMATACGAAPTPAGDKVTDAQLPINQRFHSLDDYLAFLEKTQAPIDKPWYRQVRPGVYELQTGNFRPLGAEVPKRTFTREELERKFGFSR